MTKQLMFMFGFIQRLAALGFVAFLLPACARPLPPSETQAARPVAEAPQPEPAPPAQWVEPILAPPQAPEPVAVRPDPNKLPFIVVTDVDDTIKATEVEDIGYTIYNAFFGDDAFAGMSTLYAAISVPETLVALSGAPKITRKYLNRFFKKHKFQPGTVYMKDHPFQGTFDYKYGHLKELAAQRQGRFLLIGDDTQDDPEVYEAFRKHFPKRVLPPYIRRVTGRAIPAPSLWFYTALDIAQTELAQKRIDVSTYLRVGQNLLEADDDSFLPEFAACPGAPHFIVPTSIARHPQLGPVRAAVDARMKALCTKRYRNPNWRRFYWRECDAQSAIYCSR